VNITFACCTFNRTETRSGYQCQRFSIPWKGKESVKKGRKASLYRLNLYRVAVAQILSVKAYYRCIVKVPTMKIVSDAVPDWRNIMQFTSLYLSSAVRELASSNVFPVSIWDVISELWRTHIYMTQSISVAISTDLFKDLN